MLVAAAALAAVGLAASGSRLRSAALASAVVAVAWGWGSVRLAQLDHSVLAGRIGTAEWAVVEVEEPPRPGTFDQRMKVLVLRWGTLRADEQALLELPLGRSPPQGARLRLLGELRAPPGPSNGFDEAKWLRRQGIHVVLRAQSYRVIGRRGGVSGVGDRVGRWLAGDTTPGLAGDRRDVIEAIVLGRTSGVDQGLLADFRATGLYHCLAVDGLKVAAVGGGAVAIVLLLGLGVYVAQLAALATVAAYALAVGLHPSVVRAALAAGLGSLAWLAGRERDRWQALLVGAAVLLGWNPYALFDAGFQLSFAAVASIFVVTPRVVRALEGYPVSHELAQLDRRVHGMRSCDCARDVVPVPPDLARHRPGERRGGPGRRRGARPRAPDGGRRARRAVGRRGDGRAQRVGRLARSGLCACVREHPRRADHLPSRGRRSRPGSGRLRRLCLAAWRASAS